MYPLPPHTVTDPAVLHRTIDAFPLATLISTGPDGAVVSHVPLLVDRDRGPLGTLVGHLDRTNPQALLLDGGEVLAVFHGPNCYVSPGHYVSQQLPTWNSITVHARGTASLMGSEGDLRRWLTRLVDHVETGLDRFVLTDDDPRVPPLLPHIVGFEVPIASLHGRFKLSQEKAEPDRQSAGRHLLAVTQPAARDYLAEVLGLDR